MRPFQRALELSWGQVHDIEVSRAGDSSWLVVMPVDGAPVTISIELSENWNDLREAMEDRRRACTDAPQPARESQLGNAPVSGQSEPQQIATSTPAQSLPVSSPYPTYPTAAPFGRVPMSSPYPPYPTAAPFGPVPMSSPYPPYPMAAPILVRRWYPTGPMAGVVWAGMGIRMAAAIIDAAVLFVILCVGTAIAEFGYHEYGPESGYSAPATVTLWICLAALVAYVPCCWRFLGGTIGQWTFRLRVLRSVDGNRLGVRSLTVRYLVWAVCVFTVLVGVLSTIAGADRPDKRDWPDQASGSSVVKLT